MSQSATLYRVSKDTFRQLEKSSGQQRFDISSAKDYATFHGSFMGLEYILSKEQDAPTTELISEIFNPKRTAGVQDFYSLTLQEQMQLYENLIPYLDSDIISKLDDLLDKVSETDIHSKYDANELNKNGIYPEVWQNDNSPNQAFNELQLLEDFTNLKMIVNQAAAEGDYIFVFVG